MRTKGRARESASRARPFVHIHLSRIFLCENSILYAYPECTFGVGRPNIPVLAARVASALGPVPLLGAKLCMSTLLFVCK
jgi:hypothetical protein